MFDFDEFDEIADQIASDMGLDEALSLAHEFMPGETRTVIERTAVALCRSSQERTDEFRPR